MITNKVEFFEDLWPEIYASRQNGTVVTWPATGVEEYVVNGEKILNLVVSNARIKGLIPLDETGIITVDNPKINKARLTNLIGQEVAFIVTRLDKTNDIFTASRKQAMEKMATRTWGNITEGQIRTAIARRPVRRKKEDGTMADIGIIVEIDGIEAFLAVQDISYGWVGDISALIQSGDTFNVKVMEVNKEKDRLNVSIKDMYENPWPGCVVRYNKGATYVGTVTGIAQYGVFVNLEPGVDVLCKLPKAGKVNKGDQLAIVLTKIDAQSQKISGVITKFIRRG